MKSVIIRDSVLGYIEIPQTIMDHLADTPEMQRLKDIKQSFMHPLYPNALHDRFSHSMGVFHFGKLVFNAYKENTLDMFRVIQGTLIQISELNWSKWEVLFLVACVLHDLGHAPFSHTYEFAYVKDQASRTMQPERPMLVDLARIYAPIDEELSQRFQDYATQPMMPSSPKAHELRGVYLIANQDASDCMVKTNFVQKIKDILKDYADEASVSMKDESKFQFELSDIGFIARMITGEKYSCSSPEMKLETEIKNCIIKLLNGGVDVDSIDYLTRDRQFSGYDGYGLDNERFVNSFTTIVNQKNGELVSCELGFKKNALSVLQSYVDAKHFEAFWIFGHHKVMYHTEILWKYLLHEVARYLQDKAIQERNKMSLAATNVKPSVMYRTELNKYVEEIINSAKSQGKDISRKQAMRFVQAKLNSQDNQNKQNSVPIDNSDIALNAQICKVVDYKLKQATISNRIFCSSSDSDIYSLYKSVYLELLNQCDSKYEHLLECLAELFGRREKKSLWKSYYEFYSFINQCKASALKELVSEGIVLKGKDKKVIDKVNMGIKALIREMWSDCRIEFDDGNKIYLINEPNKYDQNTKIVYRETAEKISAVVKRSMFIERPVYYKNNLKDYKIVFSVGEGDTENYTIGDIGLISEKKYEVNTMLYFYFSIIQGEKESDTRKKIQSILREKLIELLCDQFRSIKGDKMPDIIEREMLFRDAVHGDIHIPYRYEKVIGAIEMQRLNNIRQLGASYLVFPNANHTRFAHSLGVYYITNKIIHKFLQYFTTTCVQCSQCEIDMALLAALLHDVGHGPFSHVFERLSKEVHEKRTTKLITGKTEVNQAIQSIFASSNTNGEQAKRIADFIAKEDMSNTDNTLDLLNMFKKLVSSQLDADRLDYLLRDAYNCGVGYCKVDIEKIVAAMEITEVNSKYDICFNARYLCDIEDFLISRFRMYQNVYYDPNKVFFEELLIKIGEYVKEKQIKCDILFHKFITNTLTLDEFLVLDDNYVLTCLKKMCDLPEIDEVLKTLIQCYFKTKIFTQLRIFDNSTAEIDHFKRHVDIIMKEFDPNFDFNAACFFVSFSKTSYIYDHEKSPINILCNDGQIRKMEDVSYIIKDNLREKDPSGKNIYLEKSFVHTTNAVYFSEEIFLKVYEGIEDITGKLERLKKYMFSCDPRNNIEIEKKYICNQDAFLLVEDYCKRSNDREIVFNQQDVFVQEDVYYDTDNDGLKRNNIQLRIRKNGNKKVCTIKKVDVELKNFDSQVARYEHEFTVSDANIHTILEDNKDYAHIKQAYELVGKEDLREKLKVINSRKKIDASNPYGFQCEIALDNVEFINLANHKTGKLCQIEVELKSDYFHRAAMKALTDSLTRWLTAQGVTLKITNKSKYELGLECTK